MDSNLIAMLTGFFCLTLGALIGRLHKPDSGSKNALMLVNEDASLAYQIQAAVKAETNTFKESDAFRQQLALERALGQSEGQRSAIVKFKSSEDFSNLLSIEHEKGKRAGASDELAKFHITYTPVLVDAETYFSRKVDAGYDMQISYSGFPIGEPTRRITHRQEKSKDENIKSVLNTVNSALELSVEVASKSGIPLTIGKSPKRVQKQ